MNSIIPAFILLAGYLDKRYSSLFYINVEIRDEI